MDDTHLRSCLKPNAAHLAMHLEVLVRVARRTTTNEVNRHFDLTPYFPYHGQLRQDLESIMDEAYNTGTLRCKKKLQERIECEQEKAL
ncbi:hypothetical protein BGZ65_009107, partial [Modicella reniformis]